METNLIYFQFKTGNPKTNTSNPNKVGAVVEWLRRRDGDRKVPGSNPDWAMA